MSFFTKLSHQIVNPKFNWVYRNLKYYSSQSHHDEMVPFSTQVLHPKGYSKGKNSKADMLWLDLQDGASKKQKPLIRKLISNSFDKDIFEKKSVVVRLNELTEPEELNADLNATLKYASQIFGFALPMVDTGQDIAHYEEIVEKMAQKNGISLPDLRYFPIIETPSSVKNIYNIAKASPRVTGLYLGEADLLAALGTSHPEALDYIRQKFVTYANAAKVYPIGGAYTALDDLVGLESKCMELKRMGFVGKVALHPKQLSIIRKVFDLSMGEVKWANRVITDSTQQTSHRHSQSGREFFGPPHSKLAEKILKHSSNINRNSNYVPKAQPKMLPGGLSPESLVGADSKFYGQFNLHVSDGLLSQWDGLVFNSDKLNTDPYSSKSLGFRDRLVPSSLLMTLTAALTVSRLTESAKVHLGFKNCKHLKPVYPGDSLNSSAVVFSVRESQSGQGTILGSYHFLKNQKKEVVYQLEKMTLFPKLNSNYDTVSIPDPNMDETDLYRKIVNLDFNRINSSHSSPALKEGDLLAHRLGKFFGRSEVINLCYAIRVTNSHHYDGSFFLPSELLVPGPFVIQASLASARFDLGEIVYEQIIESSNLLKVNHEDTINAVTFVSSVAPVVGNPQLETLNLVTLGIKNIDPNSLAQESLPLNLFDSANTKTSQIHKVCEQSIPFLINRVVCKTTYQVTRVINSNSSTSKVSSSDKL